MLLRDGRVYEQRQLQHSLKLDHRPGLGHHERAQGAVRGEYAVEADHVKARWQYRGDEARDEVERLHRERARAIGPRLLELETQTTVVQLCGRSCASGGLAA